MATNPSGVPADNPAPRRWQDQLILLLGLWQFITPWVFSYPIPSPEATNAFITGAVLAILSAFELYKTYLWAVIVNLLVGIWVVLAPWALHVANQRDIKWDGILVGLAVVILALWEMRTDPELQKRWRGAGHAT